MDYSAIILAIAKTVGVPGHLMLAICSQESNLKNVLVPHDVGSPSYGICQIKSNTAKMLGFKGLPIGLMDPHINVAYAAKYLKMQLKRYDNDWCKAAAAYNAGSYNPSKHDEHKPRNILYVKGVLLRLDENVRHCFVCGPKEVKP